MSSQITHTQSSSIHSLVHILDTYSFIFSICALSTASPNRIMYWHPSPLQVITTRAREGSSKEHRAKQKRMHETHSVTYVPGLSTLFYLLHIVAQPPPQFLCCPSPKATVTPFIQPTLGLPHTLPPLTSATNTLLAIGYSSIFPHAQTISILFDPLYSLTSLVFQLSYAPFIPNSIHSRHSNQTSQTLRLKNIHFPSISTLSTSHTPCLCSVQHHCYNYSFILTLLGHPHIHFTSSISCHLRPQVLKTIHFLNGFPLSITCIRPLPYLEPLITLPLPTFTHNFFLSHTLPNSLK